MASTDLSQMRLPRFADILTFMRVPFERDLAALDIREIDNMKSGRLKAIGSFAPGLRNLLAATCLSLFPFASFAQSSVTLYEVISVDIGI